MNMLQRRIEKLEAQVPHSLGPRHEFSASEFAKVIQEALEAPASDTQPTTREEARMRSLRYLGEAIMEVPNIPMT